MRKKPSGSWLSTLSAARVASVKVGFSRVAWVTRGVPGRSLRLQGLEVAAAFHAEQAEQLLSSATACWAACQHAEPAVHAGGTLDEYVLAGVGAVLESM